MSRRVATMTVTAVLLVALVSLAWLFPVPYVAMSPGPTENVLGTVDGRPVIEIDDYPTYETSGRLDLTTVSATRAGQKLDLVEAIKGWLDPHVAVVPTSYLYPDDRTPQEVEQVNAELMETSQHDAVAAALKLAGKPVRDVVVVQSIMEEAPALGKLKAGDTIVAVDGTKAKNPGHVSDLVGAHRPGETVTFTVRRNGKEQTHRVTTRASEDDPEKGVVGIGVAAGYEFEGDVEINLGQDIGGPSAGSMFALGIYDKLTEGELTAGKHIAGTGTIDGNGRIGPIGGIQQKIAGARESGATVFLVPADNCPDAVGLDIDGIRLVRVENLAGAVDAMQRLADGRVDQVPVCTAGS